MLEDARQHDHVCGLGLEGREAVERRAVEAAAAAAAEGEVRELGQVVRDFDADRFEPIGDRAGQAVGDADAQRRLRAAHVDQAERARPALMHNMSAMEYQGEWARCWVDLGTSDDVALDVLINTLRQLSAEVVEIEELLIGGVNEDWPVEDHPDSLFPLADPDA